MKTMRSQRCLCARFMPVIIGWIFLTAHSNPLANAMNYENAPELGIAKLVPAAWLGNPRFQLDAKVPTDGFWAKITLRSKYGNFEVQGPGMLEVRIAEVIALEKIDALENDQAFVDGAKDAASDTAKGLKTWV